MFVPASHAAAPRNAVAVAERFDCTAEENNRHHLPPLAKSSASCSYFNQHDRPTYPLVARRIATAPKQGLGTVLDLRPRTSSCSGTCLECTRSRSPAPGSSGEARPQDRNLCLLRRLLRSSMRGCVAAAQARLQGPRAGGRVSRMEGGSMAGRDRLRGSRCPRACAVHAATRLTHGRQAAVIQSLQGQ
jgi:hypothetical protein